MYRFTGKITIGTMPFTTDNARRPDHALHQQRGPKEIIPLATRPSRKDTQTTPCQCIALSIQT